MRHDEITRMVIASVPDDWAVIGQGPLYIDSPEGDTHTYLAVFRADVDLRLAWGYTLDENLSFEGWSWPDKAISRLLVDTFWQGALVARQHVLLVDGGRCYLPNPRRAYVKTGESIEGSETVGWTAKTSEIALARLLQDIAHPAGEEYDIFLDQAGVIEVPDE